MRSFAGFYRVRGSTLPEDGDSWTRSVRSPMFFRDMRGPLKTSEPLFLRTLRAPMLYRDTRSPMFYRDMRSPMYYREMGQEPLVLRSQKDLDAY